MRFLDFLFGFSPLFQISKVRLGKSADAGSSGAAAKRFLLATQSAIAIPAEMHTSGIMGIR
jgi:hypothetical protein